MIQVIYTHTTFLIIKDSLWRCKEYLVWEYIEFERTNEIIGYHRKVSKKESDPDYLYNKDAIIEHIDLSNDKITGVFLGWICKQDQGLFSTQYLLRI